jgi:hypothetical protein
MKLDARSRYWAKHDNRWVVRQRVTAELVRFCYDWLIANHKRLSPQQIYNLTRLTWITKSPDKSVSDKCIESVKKPALGELFGLKYEYTTIDALARRARPG